MSEYVLDASAVLALMFLEPGREKVESILSDSVIGRVNVTEILTKLLEKGSSLEEAIENFADLDLRIAEFDEEQSRKIAELRPLTRHLGLSLGDRACLALAIIENAAAVTADRNWASLSICPVEVIR